MALAERLSRLGTETAFAVSLAAAEWGAKGNTIYPFHLGDLNLPTPRNVVEAMDKAIADGKTGYCPAAGIPQLREALADDVGARRGLRFAPSNVVVAVVLTVRSWPPSTVPANEIALLPLDVSTVAPVRSTALP